MRWSTILRRRLTALRGLAADAVLFARSLVALSPLGATRAARALRADRERMTCHAAPATAAGVLPPACVWEGCPLGGAAFVPPRTCFLIGAP